MINKLKKNKLYVKYGAIILFIALVVICSIKIIIEGDQMLDWGISVVSRFFSIISPIIYGVIIAYILYKPIKIIEKYIVLGLSKIDKKNRFSGYNKIVRVISILIMFAVILFSLFLIYDFLIPPMVENINGIIESIPDFQQQVTDFINNAVESLNNNNIDVTNTGEVTGEIVNNVSLFAETLLAGIVGAVSNISSFVVDLVVTVILTVYFLLDKERLVYQMKKVRDTFLSYKAASAVTTFFRDVDEVVGGFIVGTILNSIIVAIVSTVLLLLIKHPFAVLIGVIAGITNVIPYIGPIIGAALAFVFGLFTSLPMGLLGAALLLLYQQIDGNFVQPKIIGDSVGLAPVWIMIAVLIGGSYFGAAGMILSMPIAGLIRVYFNRYAEYKKRKKLEDIN